jgi:hypothetical protein
MGQSARRSFTEHLLSPATLTPVVLGICAAAVVWGFDLASKMRGGSASLAIFLAVLGCLGGAGTLMSLRILSAKDANPEVAKKQKELLAVLDALADGVQHGPAPEPDLATASAPIERA